MKKDSRQKIKRNLQIALSIVLIIALPFTLTGCLHNEDNNKPSDSTSVVPNDQQITLIWWNLFESQEDIQPLIDAYNAIHPNVTIEYSEKSLSDYQTSLDKVLTDGQPATTPDIFTIHNSWMGRYQNYVMAAPSEVTDTASFESAFYPVVNQDVIRDGQPYAIPLGVDSLALIYNKDLLEAKGYTVPSDDWTELLEQAKNLTQVSGSTYQKVGLSMGADENSNEFWFDIINLLLMQSNVQMLNAAEDAAIFADDTATGEAAEYFRSYESETIWNPSLKQDIALFLEGKLAMYIAPSWRLMNIVQYNETYDLGLDIGIAPLPQLSSLEEERVGWSTYWVQGVSVDSQYYKVAWDFLNFAAQADQLRLVFEHASDTRPFGQIYPRKDMKTELEEHEYLSVYVDEVSTSKSWNMVDGEQVKVSFKKWLNGESDVGSAQEEVTQIVTVLGPLTAGE